MNGRNMGDPCPECGGTCYFCECEVFPLLEDVNSLRQWVVDLHSGMYVNCVYCGHRYGPEDSTPVSMAEMLKRHVQECPEHPMSELRRVLKLVPPLLTEIRGFANDAFGGPSSLTDCIDLVLSEAEKVLGGVE